MYLTLVVLIILLFLAMLFVNVYFRVRVLKHYKKLVAARVEFDAGHVFNRNRLEAEILPKYPNNREDILAFVDNMHRTIRMASVLIFLITAFGAVLMWYREV